MNDVPIARGDPHFATERLSGINFFVVVVRLIIRVDSAGVDSGNRVHDLLRFRHNVGFRLGLDLVDKNVIGCHLIGNELRRDHVGVRSCVACLGFRRGYVGCLRHRERVDNGLVLLGHGGFSSVLSICLGGVGARWSTSRRRRALPG